MKRLAILVVLVLAGRAYAYPQFQLSKDQSCVSCHISPAGGGLLNDNGLAVADAMSMFGSNPAVLDGLIDPPAWLTLGGDFRGAGGYLATPQRYLTAFPMQADLYGSAKYANFRAYVTVGFRPGIYTTSTTSADPQLPWSREHYLMWQPDADKSDGLFVRAGRFMPVFGLRFAEHVDYTRRFGGTQLYAETYGAAVEYVTDKYEGHFTAFIRDRLIDTVEHASGGAAYAEYRIDEATAVGAEAMVVEDTQDAHPKVIDHKYRGGVTAKRYFSGPEVMLQGELQLLNTQLPNGGGAPNAVIGYLMGSWWPDKSLMVDVGIGHYDANIRVANLNRDCFDVNVHWFTTSHIEVGLITRFETFAFLGSDIAGMPSSWYSRGGPTGGYAMVMAHYRL